MNTTQARENVQPTIGSLVAKDYRNAAVFKKYGIDFCCNGNRTIEVACDHDLAKSERLRAELSAVTERGKPTQGTGIDFGSWPIDLLADYIEKMHHRYVEQQIPVLQAYLDKLCKVHGNRHPELIQIRDLFEGSAAELSAHMNREEMLLFPFIRKMAVTTFDQDAPMAPFGSVENPIQAMMHEHDAEGARFREIVALSNNYTPPEDACATYKVTFALLQEFEEDLHLHIHLENNILFPKAIALEAGLQGQDSKPPMCAANLHGRGL